MQQKNKTAANIPPACIFVNISAQNICHATLSKLEFLALILSTLSTHPLHHMHPKNDQWISASAGARYTRIYSHTRFLSPAISLSHKNTHNISQLWSGCILLYKCESCGLDDINICWFWIVGRHDSFLPFFRGYAV